MFIYEPLKHRNIALLWGGQVLSNIGDEMYKVAMVWLATGILGAKAGYLSALQVACIFIFSLVGGIWADEWNHRKTMIAVDLLRGLAVCLPPLMFFLGPPTLLVLIVMTIIVSSLTALFDPAMQATFPEVATELELLQATNGLMQSTARLARVVGPAVVAFCNAFVPIIHFFTIDAVSFFVSAYSIGKVHASLPSQTAAKSVSNLRESLQRGALLIIQHPQMRFMVLTSSIVNAAWYLVIPLSVTLYLRTEVPNSLAVLGWIVSAYGVGNVASNLFFGSIRIERPALLFGRGRLTTGIGFMALGLVGHVPWMMVFAAFAAIGGPMTDLAFLTILQKDFTRKDIPKVYRFAMAADYGLLFVCYLLSPILFSLVSARSVIIGCGATIFVGGIFGVIRSE